MALNQIKNTIRDGGSTTLCTAFTVYTVFTIYTVFTVYTVVTVYTIFTVNTIQTALYCLPVYIIFGKDRTLLEWADALLSKMLGDGLDGWSGWSG